MLDDDWRFLLNNSTGAGIGAELTICRTVCIVTAQQQPEPQQHIPPLEDSPNQFLQMCNRLLYD